MTYFQLYKNTEQTLINEQIENSSFVALQLVLNSFKLSQTDYLINKNNLASHEGTVELLMKLGRVVSGEPLQYVLGSWEFMGLDFFVGNGVLIPRPETELLVEKSLELLKEYANPVIFDLCSGTGCIAISIAKSLPNAKVYAVEKSDLAISYLTKNIDKHNVSNIIPIKYDIFDGFDGVFFENPDLIISNPPYIETQTVSTLDNIVKNYEPLMALDGGKDGLIFYRCIVESWINNLKENGNIAFECGNGQSALILEMIKDYFIETKYYNDLSNIDRVVVGKHKK